MGAYSYGSRLDTAWTPILMDAFFWQLHGHRLDALSYGRTLLLQRLGHRLDTALTFTAWMPRRPCLDPVWTLLGHPLDTA